MSVSVRGASNRCSAPAGGSRPDESQPFGALVRTPLQCLARSLDTVALTDINVAAEAYSRAELAPQNAVAVGRRRRRYTKRALRFGCEKLPRLHR